MPDAGNTSSAVRAQRHDGGDARDTMLDYFPTPPWATRALTEWLERRGHGLPRQVAWEPACGEMHMARPLAEAFARVVASDVQPYPAPLGGSSMWAGCCDFLAPLGVLPELPEGGADWVITNPPFNRARPFITRALAEARIGVAILIRTQFLHGQERVQDLFLQTPPSAVLIFAERVVMLKGRLVRPEWINPKTGRGYSTASDYVWLVWERTRAGTSCEVEWLPPCRRRLERDADYGEVPHA